jgi:hypothetical protein
VEFAPRYVGRLSHPKRSFRAADANGQRTLQHLDSFVLSNVRVPGNPAATVESHLRLEKLAVGFAAGLQERHMLAREGIVEVFARCHRLNPTTQGSVLTRARRPPCRSGRFGGVSGK